MKIDFSFPEYSNSYIITHDFRIDNAKQHRRYGSIDYDMVIGRDLLHLLRINDEFETASIRWKN